MTLDTVLMMVNFGPYISQFGDDLRQLVVGGGTAQAPELKSKKEHAKTEVIQSGCRLRSSKFINAAIEICNLF